MNNMSFVKVIDIDTLFEDQTSWFSLRIFRGYYYIDSARNLLKFFYRKILDDEFLNESFISDSVWLLYIYVI